MWEVSALIILISCLNDGPKSVDEPQSLKMKPRCTYRIVVQGPLPQVSSGDVTVDPELRGGCWDMVFPKDVDSFGGKQQNQV